MTDFSSPAPPPGYLDPLTLAQVATLFNVNPKTIGRWEKTGRITASRSLGRQRRFWWSEIQRAYQAVNSDSPDLAPAARTSAWIQVGNTTPRIQLRLTPEAHPEAQPGRTAVILGYTATGLPVALTAVTLEWLDDLEAAIQRARAAGVVQAGMQPVLR